MQQTSCVFEYCLFWYSPEFVPQGDVSEVGLVTKGVLKRFLWLYVVLPHLVFISTTHNTAIKVHTGDDLKSFFGRRQGMCFRSMFKCYPSALPPSWSEWPRETGTGHRGGEGQQESTRLGGVLGAAPHLPGRETRGCGGAADRPH